MRIRTNRSENGRKKPTAVLSMRERLDQIRQWSSINQVEKFSPASPLLRQTDGAIEVDAKCGEFGAKSGARDPEDGRGTADVAINLRDNFCQ